MFARVKPHQTLYTSDRTSSFRYIIFPPWADFSFSWAELPTLFLEPEKWDVGRSAVDLAKFGYSVHKGDQIFYDGPNGGGIVAIKRDLKSWSPKVLIQHEADLMYPPRFSRVIDYPLHIAVPRILATHKLGLTPVPLAPSP